MSRDASQELYHRRGPGRAARVCLVFRVVLDGTDTNGSREHPDPVRALSTVLGRTVGGGGSAPAACLLQLMERCFISEYNLNMFFALFINI